MMGITLHHINTHPPSNPVTAVISLIIRITVDFPLYSQRTFYTDSASRSILCPLAPANGLFGQDEVTHFDTFVVVSSTTIQDGPSIISYYIMLYYNILHYIILCSLCDYIILYYIILYYVILYYTILYNMI